MQKFKFGGTKKLSEESFVILCEGVAFSRVRRFDLCLDQFQGVGLETMVEWLALTIRVSSLEEVRMVGCLGEKCGCIGMVVSALRRTDPVQNMDFTFTQTGMDFTFTQTDRRGQRILEINRKLKPLVFGADISLGLWPYVIERLQYYDARASHDRTDLVFYALRQRPDLVRAGIVMSNKRHKFN